MRTPFSPLPGIFLLSLVSAPRLNAAPAPTADARARVLVLSRVEFPATVTTAAGKLAAALTDAVTQRGYEVASAQPTTCLDDDCLRALATKASATDVLIVQGGATDLFGYAIDLRLWSATTDRQERTKSQCNTCTATQMIDMVTPAVGSLLDRIPALNAPAAAALTAPPPTVSPPPQLVARPPTPAPPPKLSPGRVALGSALIAAGGVSLGFGISMMASNGDQSGCLTAVCNSTKSGSTLGTALTIGGGVLAAAGATVLLFFRDEPGTSVAIGPTGFSIGGTY
jgi:hypothetical protein